MAEEPAPAAPKRLRVVYCLDSFDTGGTELNAVRTVEQIDRSRFDVSFVSLSGRGALAERVREAGIPVEVIVLDGFFTWRSMRAGCALVRYLRAERVQVLHAHDIYSNILAVPCARIAGVPLVIASRRWWHAANRRLYLALNRLTYKLAHRVLANSESVGRLVAEEGIAPERIAVIPNFVEDYAFEPPPPDVIDTWRRELGLRPDDEVVGIIANLHAVKDHATLLRALPRILAERPGVRLVLVGDGAQRASLEALATSLGVRDRVIMAGPRPQRPTMHWLFDLSVLCSLGEGFPNSVVEAMAAGRAVVATAVGGVPDVVADQETGLLVPPASPDLLATAILSLLTDPERRQRMGAVGATRARTLFHAPRVLARLERLYHTAIPDGNR